MVSMVEAIEGCALPYCPLVGYFFKDTFPELQLWRTHFHKEKEYMNIPLVRALKEHDNFSFERFCTMVNTYLAFRRELVCVELDAQEVCHHIATQEGRYVTQAWDILARNRRLHILTCDLRMWNDVFQTLLITACRF